MNWWQRLWKREEIEQRLDKELRFHFESQVADNIRAGMTEEEARRRARISFGGVESVKEECREVRGTLWVESTLQDLRLTLRMLWKSPAFTIAAIGTLALGIGANTAIFQLLDAVRLRSLPVPEPQQLARIQIRSEVLGFIEEDNNSLTYPLWEEIRDHQQAFAGVFAWSTDTFRIGEGRQTRRAAGLMVSGDFFTTLQVPPATGRLFSRDDDQLGCASPGVVLSYAFWQSEFGAESSAIGKRFVVLDHPFHIIGVTPAAFTGLEVGRKFDFALPICAQALLDSGISGIRSMLRRDVFWLKVMGRLRPDWKLAQASGHLSAISPGLFEATVPSGYSAESLERYRGFHLQAIPAGNGVSYLREQYDTSLWLLLGISGLVLLIACANLANLMLARASARQREFAVRLALGASRLRLIRQSLSESLVLAFTGAALGLVLARTLSNAILWFLGEEGNALPLDLSLDWRMMAFTASVAVLACVILGLAPALRSSRAEPSSMIKSGGRGLTTDRERFSFQRMLVVIQISVSLVLVVGALLFVRSFRNLMTLDPGFRPKGVLLAFFDMKRLRLPQAAIKPFEQQMLDAVRATPQVESAATTTNVLIGGGSWSLIVRVGSLQQDSKFTWVSPGYFATVETPILAGRDFNANDIEMSPKVAIVNQKFVQRYFGKANPIGKMFRTVAEPNYPEAQYEIVGVIKDTKYMDLRDPAPPIAYLPASQFPEQGPWSTMYIRSSAPLGGVMSAVKQRIAAMNPEISTDFQIFETQIQLGLIRERLMAALSGFFGALAALLATIGLYGVIAYVVVRRRNEIGIRMALGASRTQVIGLVMREAALLVLIGVSAGIVASLALARTAASLLFGLSARDPLTFVSAAVLLALVAAIGSFLPAHRASRVDPMIALRYE